MDAWDRARKQPQEVIEAITELESLRKQKALIAAREKLLREIIIASVENELSPPTASGEERIAGKTIDIGVARITRRRGSESVDISLLRSKLGEDAEEFIIIKKGATVISHVNALIAEEILKESSLGEKM